MKGEAQLVCFLSSALRVIISLASQLFFRELSVRITQGETVDLQTVLHIELEDADTEPYLDMGYRKVRPYVTYPGFRKGRAPRHIVMQMVGREAILNEALDSMLPEIAGKAIQEQQIEMGGVPSMEVLDLDPVTFRATVPLRPQVDIGAYRDIRIEAEETEVSQDDVQERLEQLRRSMSSWEPVERPARLGDMVTMTATATVEGESVLDETDTVYFLDADAAHPFPGFAEALAGAELDATREFELDVPDDFENSDVAGKRAHVQVTVSDAKEQILPELDEEFAQGVGEGYDSLDALREQVESELKAEAESASRQRLSEAAMQSLMDGASAEIAPMIIDNEVNYMMNEQAQMLAGMNIRMADYIRATGATEAEVRESLREEAANRIKRSLALSKLSELEGIDVSDDDVEERIEFILERQAQAAESADAEPPEITDDVRAGVRQALHTEKTLERLVAIAKGEAPALTDGDDGGATDAADAETDDAADAADETDAPAQNPS